jgi:phage shock protein A
MALEDDVAHVRAEIAHVRTDVARALDMIAQLHERVAALEQRKMAPRTVPSGTDATGGASDTTTEYVDGKIRGG